MSSQQPFNMGPGQGPSSGGGAVTISNRGMGLRPGGVASSGSDGVSDGEVDHVDTLSKDFSELFVSSEYSDVTLVVSSQRFPAHRVVLAARSEVFRAMLFGGMKESHQEEVVLKDTPPDAFRHLLKYIYTGRMELTNLTDNLILEILGLTHQYGFTELEKSISDYLQSILSVHNACFVYDAASFYQLGTLIAYCASFIDRNAEKIMRTASLQTLSASGLRNLISRDSFCADEVTIFKTVQEWVGANPDEDPSEILQEIRLSLMSVQDLLVVVRPTGLVPPDVILDAIHSQHQAKMQDLRHRGFLYPEENIALLKHGAQVMTGEVRQALIDGDSNNYDMERGFTRHTVRDGEEGIIVNLGRRYILNHFKMLLWDRDGRAYSYYIEVSLNQKDWYRVVDYSNYLCRAWQFLYFPSRVLQYIKIVGTHNTQNKVFHVVSLEAYFTNQEVPNVTAKGIIVPKHNVATIPLSAIVTEGVCRTRNALLNGDTSNYNWDTGYTCHQLGCGSIIVQLGQPYIVSSMRLLLWDCDERTYSYYIEVSVNGFDWELVCDRSKEACKSWQLIKFTKRPVTFIRIVGTQNTANEVFHCVHFECPSTFSSDSMNEDKEEDVLSTDDGSHDDPSPENNSGYSERDDSASKPPDEKRDDEGADSYLAREAAG